MQGLGLVSYEPGFSCQTSGVNVRGVTCWVNPFSVEISKVSKKDVESDFCRYNERGSRPPLKAK